MYIYINCLNNSLIDGEAGPKARAGFKSRLKEPGVAESVALRA